MSLSVVLPIWIDRTQCRHWLRDLENALWTLKNQSAAPDEIIIVDGSPDKDDRGAVCYLVESYDATYVEALLPAFHLTRLFNIGIRKAQSDYIACAGFEMMWSQNYIKYATELLQHDVCIGTWCGFLAEDVEIPPPNQLFDIWQSWVDNMIPAKYSETQSYYRWTTGGIQLMHRDWWYKLRGFNENLMFALTDTDLVRRVNAIRGLDRYVIKWEKEAQMIHPWHPRVNLDEQRERDKGMMGRQNTTRWGEL